MRLVEEQTATSAGRRHQWGAEKSTTPLPILHRRPTITELLWCRVAIVITVGALVMYLLTTILRLFLDGHFSTVRSVVEMVVYVLVVALLDFSALMYLLSRQGALTRFRQHERVPRAVLDGHFALDYPHSITVLVPSYVEEVKVVTKTLWSAALQEFPRVRVVLLIDDPPHPAESGRYEELTRTRRLAADITQELAEPAARFRTELNHATKRLQGQGTTGGSELSGLASQYLWAAQWLEAKARRWPVDDHTDEFFVDRVLGDLAVDLRRTAHALTTAVAHRERLDCSRALQLYRRLEWIFDATIHCFERKNYASLSHEANKAMNLNSYLGLMGGRWKRVESPQGTVLRAVQAGEYVDVVVPNSEYVLTLDADSMLLRDYCLRLVYELEQPENSHVAVIQTPYSSYRGAPTRMERIAAATTDVQHILHQGLTHYDATFWVGANAIIRRKALDDIAHVTTEQGHTITTYIQDRTVIEDTESSVDLGLHGWHLVNYPERLSYSATPPDFGALVVQRRRWANGGLLILPKFLRQRRLRKRTPHEVRPAETALRVNYMASIAWASIGLLLLLAYPFDQQLLSPWVIAAAAPYFLSMSQDLKDSGYRRLDVVRIYGFNLILLAVNLAGSLKSIQQGLTDQKIPFARTPKVANRTSSPWPYVLAPYLIIGLSLFILVLDVRGQNWGNAVFAGFNAMTCAWALVSYIGIWPSLQDLALGVGSWFFVPEKVPASGRATSPGKSPAPRDGWQSWLYFGELHPNARPASDLCIGRSAEGRPAPYGEGEGISAKEFGEPMDEPVRKLTAQSSSESR